MLVHSLRSRPQVAVLSFFFTVANKHENVAYVLRALLKQLLEQFETVPSAVKNEYENTNGGGLFPSRAVLQRILTASIDEYMHLYANRLFIVVDAYDEFINIANQEEERAELRTCLRELCKDKSTRLLITTRSQYTQKLRVSFTSPRVVNIIADLEDLNRFLERQLRHQGFAKSLKDHIRKTILEETEKMELNDRWYISKLATTLAELSRFYLAKLQIEHVLAVTDPLAIRGRLKTLPKNAPAAYQGILNRMTAGQREFARRILGWVYHSRRALLMSELQEALVVELDQKSIDRSLISPPDYITHICGSLIIHSEETDHVTFSHALIRQFFEEDYPTFLPPPSVTTLTCLTYLGYDGLEGPFPLYEIYLKTVRDYKLSNYTAQYWSQHAALSGIDREVAEAIFKTFESEERRMTIEKYKNYFDAPCNKTTLHFIAEGGLIHLFLQDDIVAEMWIPFDFNAKCRVVGLVRQTNINAADTDGMTPLHYSCVAGDVDSSAWLIKHGADVKARTTKREDGFTPLHFAASQGNLGCVKMLLEANSDVRLGDRADVTALHFAARNGHLAVVEFLVTNANADPNAKDKSGNTPMHWIFSAYVHGEAVPDQLNEPTEPVPSDEDSNTIMVVRRLDVAFWLAQNGANLSDCLRAMILSGYRQFVVRLGLRKDLDVNRPDENGVTALHEAAATGDVDVIRWLLENGADIKATTKNSKTLLFFAAIGVGGCHPMASRKRREYQSDDSKLSDSIVFRSSTTRGLGRRSIRIIEIFGGERCVAVRRGRNPAGHVP